MLVLQVLLAMYFLLVPFLAEPFAVQWLPQHLAQYIVGANKKIKGENAEKVAQRNGNAKKKGLATIFS